FRRVVQLCRDEGGDSRPRINCGLATAFGCTIEGDVDEDRVRRIASEVAAAGADGIILADTVGYGQPAAIGRVFRRIIGDVAQLPPGGEGGLAASPSPPPSLRLRGEGNQRCGAFFRCGLRRAAGGSTVRGNEFLRVSTWRVG